MDQPMQSISLTATTTPTQIVTGRLVLPVLGSLRERARTFRARSTLGPSMGDHVLGEGQWRTTADSYPIR
jgi:hypothetical protein